MFIAKAIRWSGLLSVLAGGLYALAALLHPVGEGLPAVLNPRWVPAHLVYWVSAILMLVGLVGIYARQASATGWLGLSGFVLALVGTALASTVLFIVSTIIPLVAIEAPELFGQAMEPPAFAMPLFLLSFGFGYVLFGLATMRGAVFPKLAGVLLIVGVTLFIASEAGPFGPVVSHILVTVGDVVFGSGFAWLGATVLKEPITSLEQTGLA